MYVAEQEIKSAVCVMARANGKHTSMASRRKSLALLVRVWRLVLATHAMVLANTILSKLQVQLPPIRRDTIGNGVRHARTWV
jgi:hypothetical protein